MSDATNEYDLIAPFYDLEHAQFMEDLDLYLEFAELCGPYGRILELACGSGRLLLPLAREGYALTGVDSSARMLDLARARLEEHEVAQQVALVQQDMRTLQLDQQFRLAFVALGSFGHLVTHREQRQALAAIRAHLVTGATFILDISNTDARYLESMSGQLLHRGTWPAADGSLLTHFISPASWTKSHVLEITHFYDQHRQGEAVRRTISTSRLYLFEQSELELLLEQAGFEIKNVYGNYDMSAFELSSPRMIVIAEAR